MRPIRTVADALAARGADLERDDAAAAERSRVGLSLHNTAEHLRTLSQSVGLSPAEQETSANLAAAVRDLADGVLPLRDAEGFGRRMAELRKVGAL